MTKDNLTPSPPYWISVEGLSNIRDIGGWKVANKGWVRPSCIYRGCEMDTHHTLTPNAVHTMTEILHIRTDLDLRQEAVGVLSSSPLGANIQFLLIPMVAYRDFLDVTPENSATVRRLFSVLSDDKNYPIYLHCWGGADRTGTLVFLLNAILGVSYDDLIIDYEATSMSIWGPRPRTYEPFAAFLEALNKYAGDTVNQKTESFLRSCGIDDSIFLRLRSNLIEQ